MLTSFGRGMQKHPEWKDQLERCQEVMLAATMPEDPEIQCTSKLFQLQLVITFQNLDPVQTVGKSTWPKAVISNEPVTDGMGHSVPHFRYIWTVDKCDPDGGMNTSLQEALFGETS